ncbi:MAG: AAA family ATPase [Myxococcota bacterium]
MEHLKFFDLPSDPFQNESDERFYYESAPQKRARLRLMRGIQQRKSLSVLVGGPGLGKTTLAHSILRALDPREFAAHYLSIPHEACASGWFLPNVARAFGVHAPSAEIPALVDQIHAQLVSIAASQRSAVLLIDEAQLFRNRDAMEEFRGLLNLLHGGRKLVSLVLFGLPDLAEILKLDAPLAQRVEIRTELTPMDWLESQAYVSHRLRLAGATQAVFSPDALEALFRCSGGVPRLLNTVADNALFEAFLCEAKPVDSSIVAAAAESLGLVPAPVEDPYPSMPQLIAVAAPAVAAASQASEALDVMEEAPVEWLEPVAPMPKDPRPQAPPPARKPPPVEDEIVADLETAELLSESPAAEPEPMEFEIEELDAELDAEPAFAATEVDFEEEVAAEAAASTATKLDPEDSDWSLGAEVRAEEPREAKPHNRNDDSFDLRSLALEVDEEPALDDEPQLVDEPALVEEPQIVEAAQLEEEPAVEAAELASSDDDDLDALFEEIQLED